MTGRVLAEVSRERPFAIGDRVSRSLRRDPGRTIGPPSAGVWWPRRASPRHRTPSAAKTRPSGNNGGGNGAGFSGDLEPSGGPGAAGANAHIFLGHSCGDTTYPGLAGQATPRAHAEDGARCRTLVLAPPQAARGQPLGGRLRSSRWASACSAPASPGRPNVHPRRRPGPGLRRTPSAPLIDLLRDLPLPSAALSSRGAKGGLKGLDDPSVPGDTEPPLSGEDAGGGSRGESSVGVLAHAD